MVLLKSINVPLRTKAIDFCLNGQIDDNWQEPDEVTSHDLSDAIESLLEGKKPSPNQYPSMGCSIKRKEWLTIK
jgi:hypothetical protein